MKNWKQNKRTPVNDLDAQAGVRNRLDLTLLRISKKRLDSKDVIEERESTDERRER